MIRSINQDMAWSLVRAVAGPGSPGDTLLLHDPVRSDIWLRVDPDGAWTTSHPPEAEARALLDLFLPLRLRSDLVIAQAGQSLDGRIATETGHSHFVTGPEDIRRLHRVRALVDAVVVGAGTVVSDDPRLTVRQVEGENPVRVVLDPRGRIPSGSKVLVDGAAPTLVLRREGAPGGGGIDVGGGVEIVPLPSRGEEGFDPAEVLRVLRDRNLQRILVEGGGITVSRFLQAGVLNRLHVTVAPLLIGSGRASFTLDPIPRLDQAIRAPCRHFFLGEDLLFDLDLG